MKWITIALIGVILVFTNSHKAEKDISINIKYAIKKGDANMLATYFDQNLELVIDSENVDFNKINTTHAKLILKSFFKKNPPSDFQYEYQGATTSIRYCTGSYKSANEKYWVYIIIKNKNAKLAIGSIHFKKDLKL
jgi:hypothetical protein